jgi:hypothetical protein
MLWRNRYQDVGLLLDCFKNFWMLMANVGKDKLAGEI